MYVNVSMPDSYEYEVIDLDTGFAIPGVQEANDETGGFSCFLWNSQEGDLIFDHKKGEYVFFRFKGNIKIVKKERVMESKIVKNVREEEAKKITTALQNSEDLAELDEMLKNNYVEWKDGAETYKVRKPNHDERKELRMEKIKYHNELRNNPNWKYEQQIILEYANKGIDIADMINKQLAINGQIEEVQLQLAQFGAEKEADNKVIFELKNKIYNLMVERNGISLEKSNLLVDSIEQELLMMINTYTAYLVLEKKVKDKWVRVFKSYKEFMDSDNESLLEKTGSYLGMLIFRTNIKDE